VFQLAKGSAVTMSSYTAITMWVYIDKDWKIGDIVDFYGWNTVAGIEIGVAVDLSNYFDYVNYDVWQKITIPLTDLGATVGSTALDSFRFRQVANEGKAPKYYLDDIQIEELGTPVRYSLKAAKGTWLHVKEFTISIADDFAGTLSDATMPLLPYDKLLGETLIAGINYQREQNGKVIFSANVKTLLDFLQLPGTIVSGSGSDGTNTWVTVKSEHMEPLVLKNENEDELSFTINDDLSGLLHLRISAGGKIEQRQDIGGVV